MRFAITRGAPELPPRARRIRQEKDNGDSYYGTTSACAENTRATIAATTIIRNYLRVRGEYMYRSIAKPNWSELPPRARRIQAAKVELWRQYGTTSACAENTCAKAQQFPDWWNYLRVRGEYFRMFLRVFVGKELPPRARRIRAQLIAKPLRDGTTSACAENTVHA